MEKLKIALNFDVDRVEFEKEKSNRFRKGTIYAFADGPNAHTHPISNKVLAKCANSVYDIPIVCKYCDFVEDFLAHEEDEVPIGFVKETTASYSNPIRFEKFEDGRTFIVIEGLIWQKYSGNAIEVMERSDKRKSVSVELLVTDGEEVDGKIEVKEFVLQGITVLGDFVTPAVKDAHIQLEFSADKRDYLEFMANSIKIDNTKEAAVRGAWSNPRRKLFTPISKASNTAALVREAYLINEGSDTEPEISKLKYPHHVVRDGKLVIHVDGLQAAFQRAKQQGIFNGAVKVHIAKHYKELGLTTENFANFSLDEEDFAMLFDGVENKNEGVGEIGMADEIKNAELEPEVACSDEVVEAEKVECADEHAECVDCAEKPEETSGDEKTEEMAEDKPEEEMADDKPEEEEKPEEKMADNSESDEDESDDEEDEKEDEDEDAKEDKDKDEEEMSFEDAKAKIAEMSEKISKLEEDNKAYMAKIAEMADYEELKQFKCAAEERAKKEEEMAKMESVMCDIEARGVTMSDSDKEKLMAKFSEFDSVDAWANYVKAQAFDMCGTDFDNNKIGLPFAEPKTTSIWDKF